MTTDKPLILLVEDDQADVDWDVDVLRGLGLGNNVLVIRDGAEALDYFFPRRVESEGEEEEGKAATLPALVLLDLHLPKVDGLQILQRIKADRELAQIPVVVLTGSLPLAVELHEIAAETSYVVKPIVPHELVRVLRHLNLGRLLP